MRGNGLPVWLLIVLSGTIISLCMGMRQSLGLFMRPMGVDLGITAAAFGFSIAQQNIVWGWRSLSRARPPTATARARC